MATFLLVLSTEMIFVKPVASGAAERANVRLCPVSSFDNVSAYVTEKVPPPK